MLQRDQFELLSAYLDGEVTAAERRQVEQLLRSDEKTQKLYARLLRLREGFQGMPLVAAQPVEETVDKVMHRLDQRSRPRRRTWVLGGAAAAAAVATVGGLFNESPILQFANQSVPGANVAIQPARPESAEDAVFRPDEMTIAASPGAIIAVTEPTLPTDELMIGLDQPLLGLEESGSLAPMPSMPSSADQGVN